MPPDGTPDDSRGSEDPRLHLARQWLEKAQHDLRAAERVARPEPLLDIAAYHAQQAAEVVEFVRQRLPQPAP